MSSIIRDGAVMAFWTFIVVILYIVISSPFDEIITDFENLEQSDASIDEVWSLERTIFDMIFAILGLVGIIWFIMRVFRREPDWRY